LRSRHRIRVGQKLRLPDDGTGPAPTKQSREIEHAEIPSSGVYVVRRGDSISRIATRFNVEEAEILAASNLRNRNRIYVGQTLNLRAPDQTQAAKTSEPDDPHPDAVAALSSPPVRPEDKSAPAQLNQLAAVAEEQPPGEALQALLADPSEYGIRSNGSIEVQGAETLGHYAEWLDIRTSRLRSINHLSYGRAIVIGQRIKLDLSQVDAQTFEARRLQYHRVLQEEFFAQYEIEGTVTHVIRRGDSIWLLAERKYGVPLWLLRQYNPDLDFGALQRGARVIIPELKTRENGASARAGGGVRAS